MTTAFQTKMEQNNNKVKPDNFLVWAILSTVLCCLPLGIVAIVYANKVDGLWYAGKYDEAEDALKKAKMWTYISAGVGVASAVLYTIILLIIAMMS